MSNDKKVVINNCFGGFGLSPEAVLRYAELSGFKVYGYADKRSDGGRIDFDNQTYVRWNAQDSDPFIIYWLKNDIGDNPNNAQLNGAEWFQENSIERHDPNLIKAVEELKGKANGSHASLKIVSIPADVEYEIDEYDGNESIHEKHRSWS